MNTRNVFFRVVVVMFLTAMFGTETKLAAQQSKQPDWANMLFHKDSVLTNAPFVFEGRMIGGTSHGPFNVGRSYLFEIEKVYRGGERLQAGTVEVIVRLNENGLGLTHLFSKWYLTFTHNEVSEKHTTVLSLK